MSLLGTTPLTEFGRNKSKNSMAKLHTIQWFCEEYGVSRSTAYRLRDSGAVPHVKIGRAVRIRSEDAERWFASLQQSHCNDCAYG